MKYRVRLLLLVLFLTSACSLVTGKTRTVIPSHTPTAAVPSPTTAAVTPSPTALALPTRVEQAAPTITPGGPPTQTPEPNLSLLDQYLPRREKVAETEHFVFYFQDDFMPVDQDWWIAQAEEVYSYVSQRLDGSQVKNKIQLALQPPEKQACPVRGLASRGDAPMVIIFADQDSQQDYLLGVLAHEIGHAITYEGFPDGLPDNIALAEGIASWGAGKYWSDWKNVDSIHDLARGYRSAGEYEPIHENTELTGVYPWQNDAGEDCLARRDKLYSEWASFTGYLIDTYGWEKAYRLFQEPNPQRQPGQTIYYPPDFEGIYGKALNQLEWEWLEWLGRDARDIIA